MSGTADVWVIRPVLRRMQSAVAALSVRFWQKGSKQKFSRVFYAGHAVYAVNFGNLDHGQ